MKRILLLVLALSTITLYAETKTTANNGDWDDTNTWGGSLPVAGDDIIIAHDVDVDDVRSCNSLTVNSGARLDVEANLTVATTSANNGTLYIKTGDLTQSAGNFTNAGTLRVYGGYDLVFTNSSTTLKVPAFVKLPAD